MPMGVPRTIGVDRHVQLANGVPGILVRQSALTCKKSPQFKGKTAVRRAFNVKITSEECPKVKLSVANELRNATQL